MVLRQVHLLAHLHPENPALLPFLKIACVQYPGNEYFSQQSETLKQSFLLAIILAGRSLRQEMQSGLQVAIICQGHHGSDQDSCVTVLALKNYTVKVLVATGKEEFLMALKGGLN